MSESAAATTAPAGARAPESTARPGRQAPWALLAAVAAAAACVAAGHGAIRDIDLYWHLIVGDELRAGVAVTSAGRGWSIAPGVPDTWVSSQWLAELLLSWLQSAGGFPALAWYRVATTTLALGVLALVTLRHRPVRASVVPFAIAAIALASTAQERSQQLTYILAPLLGWWAERLLRHGRAPRWWLVLPLTVVWANFHGGWILLPMVLALAAVARIAHHGPRDTASWRALLLALGCGLAAMISPLGPANALTALAFSRAASSQIVEWEHVQLFADQGWQLGLALLVAVVCWARGRARPGVDEIVLVLGLITFGFLAYRNIPPTLLVLAPLLAGVMTRALPVEDPRSRPTLVRTSYALAGTGVALGLLLPFLPGQDLHGGRPVAVYERIAAHSGQLRAVNSYNLSGPLLWFGGGPTHVQVAIDGRSDRYGAAYIDSYQDTLIAARPGWQAQFDRLDPNVAVLYDNEPLVSALENEKQWRQVDEENGVVVLVPPDATGW
jgi:hypothetical protein